MVIVTFRGCVGGTGVGGTVVAAFSVGFGVGVAFGAHPVSTMENTRTKTKAVINHLRIALSSFEQISGGSIQHSASVLLPFPPPFLGNASGYDGYDANSPASIINCTALSIWLNP
jgi:hypothetical protein